MDLDSASVRGIEQFRFKGVIEDPLGLPGFLTPVFSTGSSLDSLHIQNISDAGKIESFIKCLHDLDNNESLFSELGSFPIDSYSEVHLMEKLYSRHVGGDALYTVKFPDRDVVICQAEELRIILAERIEEFKNFPSTKYSLAKFIGNKNLIDKAKKYFETKLSSKAEITKKISSLVEELTTEIDADSISASNLLSLAADDYGESLVLAFSRLRRRDTEKLMKRKVQESLISILSKDKAENSLHSYSSFIKLAGISNCLEVLPTIQYKINQLSKGGSPTYNLIEALEMFSQDTVKKMAEELVKGDISIDEWPHLLGLLGGEECYPKLFDRYQLALTNNKFEDIVTSYTDNGSTYA